MKVLILESRALAVARTVGLIIDQVRRKPDSVLGLATGGTMEPVYAGLVQACRDGEVSFADVSSFNLDEYVNLASDHPRSYRAFMQAALFDQRPLPG